MGQQVIQGSKKLGEAIKARRQELGLTIEEAASKAGVGIKTWCRYEVGESIRRDKAKGICKTLNWNAFPGKNNDDEFAFNLEEYQNHEAWSQFICNRFGQAAAISFVVGSDIVLDYLNEDLNELSQMPRGTHVGQLPVSMMRDLLPKQFLMRYDYEFLYLLRYTLEKLRGAAHRSKRFLAHSVIEELALYICNEEAEFLMETMYAEMEEEGIEGLGTWKGWVCDLFADDDIGMFLYSDFYVTPDVSYYFDYWEKEQFYTGEEGE